MPSRPSIMTLRLSGARFTSTCGKTKKEERERTKDVRLNAHGGLPSQVLAVLAWRAGLGVRTQGGRLQLDFKGGMRIAHLQAHVDFI
jgi:hypothetical protein